MPHTKYIKKNPKLYFAVTNPHITGVNTFNYDKEKLKLLQRESFKNHQFIFKILTEKEEKVLRLRYGIDDDRFLSLREVAKILDMSHEGIAKAERSAFEQLRKFDAINLMCKYTDETFDDVFFEDLERAFPNLVKRGYVREFVDYAMCPEFGRGRLERANFFKEHMYIFEVLTEYEAEVIKLTYGIEDGRYATPAKIAQKLNISLEQVGKIESAVYSKLKQSKYLKLLRTYDDKTIDKTIIEEDSIKACDKNLYLDVIQAIKHKKIDIVEDFAFTVLNVRCGNYGKQTVSLISTLNNAGIETFGQLVNYIYNFGSLKDLNINQEGIDAILERTCSAIDEGVLIITSSAIRAEYNRHKVVRREKIKEFEQIRQSKVQSKIKSSSTASTAEENLNIKDIKIDEMGFSLRVRNAIRRVGIETLEQLINFYYKHNESFDTIWDLGEKNQQQVFNKLTQYGIELNTNSFGKK